MTSGTLIIVYYQADCGFCKKCVDFILKRSAEGVFEFKDIREIKEQNSEGMRYETIIVMHAGESYEKYSACLQIARHMRSPWSFVALMLRLVPRRFGDWGYDFIARYRV